MSRNVEVATTILEQMGGRMFCMMCGVHSKVAIENGIMFGFKGSRKANKMKVTLNSMDTYDIEFWKISPSGKLPNKVVHEEKGFYNDMLVPEFEEFTGLYTRM